ncbi:hypothetical protein KBZ21_04485 [Streptomyces sp. A73]|nr:hypothetical protein [Streptomyces sp. A73]
MAVFLSIVVLRWVCSSPVKAVAICGGGGGRAAAQARQVLIDLAAQPLRLLAQLGRGATSFLLLRVPAHPSPSPTVPDRSAAASARAVATLQRPNSINPGVDHPAYEAVSIANDGNFTPAAARASFNSSCASSALSILSSGVAPAAPFQPFTCIPLVVDH